MPWYYAGPQAKPVGPVTLDELRAAHASGTVTSETYIIEHTGQAVENLSWKRYKEVFPSSPTLPAIPASTLPPVPAPIVPPIAPPAQAHPLFPSAAPIPSQTPVFAPNARPDPYYSNTRPTNGWCGWGFGLGLAGFLLCFACGTGLIPALIALPLCLVGLAKVRKNPAQAGQGLAISGLVMSILAIIVSLIMLISLAVPMIKAHQLTVTEQSSNDSE
jgi:hypothetical protein